jgi:hypothetical protein
VRRGTVSGDFDWFISGQEPGRITVDMSRLDALPEGSGTLLDLDLRIRSDALPGVSPIDLQYASLNDGRLTLNVVPQPGADETDGRITIRGKTVAELAQATAVPASNPAQATLPLFAAGEWPAPALAGSSTSFAPVIDLSASFSLPTAVSEALVADNSRKPWLKDYLGNVGQARKASPNSALKVTSRRRRRCGLRAGEASCNPETGRCRTRQQAPGWPTFQGSLQKTGKIVR